MSHIFSLVYYCSILRKFRGTNLRINKVCMLISVHVSVSNSKQRAYEWAYKEPKNNNKNNILLET